MNEADRDISKCDECGSEDGTRQLAPYHSTLAWLCGECRTRLALIESFRPDPHDRARDEYMSERYDHA